MYKNRGTFIPHPKLPEENFRRRMPSRIYAGKRDGGPDQDRTDDLLNANQALSQLSYGPTLSSRKNGGPGKT